MTASDDRESFSYEEFGEASRELAQQVADSGFQTDLVVAIARGPGGLQS